jgi:hypothetical protein
MMASPVVAVEFFVAPATCGAAAANMRVVRVGVSDLPLA